MARLIPTREMKSPSQRYEVGVAQDHGEYRDVLEAAIMGNLSMFCPNYVKSWYIEDLGTKNGNPDHIIYYIAQVGFHNRPHHVDEIVQIYEKQYKTELVYQT